MELGRDVWDNFKMNFKVNFLALNYWGSDCECVAYVQCPWRTGLLWAF